VDSVSSAHSLSRYCYAQWREMRDWVNMYLDELTDEELKSEIVPGHNHGVWILGHLVASDDTLSEYLGKGPPLFPETQVFAQTSVLKPVESCPSPAELREQWKKVCEKNDAVYRELRDEELSEPHAMIAGNYEDDFFKTKQRIIIFWTLHQVHHAGQLALLLAKFGRHLV